MIETRAIFPHPLIRLIRTSISKFLSLSVIVASHNRMSLRGSNLHGIEWHLPGCSRQLHVRDGLRTFDLAVLSAIVG